MTDEKKQLNKRVPADLVDELEKESSLTGKSQAQLVREMLESGLGMNDIDSINREIEETEREIRDLESQLDELRSDLTRQRSHLSDLYDRKTELQEQQTDVDETIESILGKMHNSTRRILSFRSDLESLKSSMDGVDSIDEVISEIRTRQSGQSISPDQWSDGVGTRAPAADGDGSTDFKALRGGGSDE